MIAFTAWSALASREPTDRAVAEHLLSQASSWPAASASAAHAPLAEARRALDRAAWARDVGDALNAGHLEGLAREWAEVARDASKAVEAEGHAASAQSSAAEVSTKVKRARALLEEQMAKRARAQGELKKLQDAGAPAIGSAAVRVLASSPRGSSASPTTRSPAGSASAGSGGAPGGKP